MVGPVHVLVLAAQHATASAGAEPHAEHRSDVSPNPQIPSVAIAFSRQHHPQGCDGITSRSSVPPTDHGSR